MSGPPERCPACESDLRKAEPEKGLRIIGIYDRNADRTVAWRCPDCGHEWERT